MRLMFLGGRKFPSVFVEMLEAQKIGGEERLCELKFENRESGEPYHGQGRL